MDETYKKEYWTLQQTNKGKSLLLAHLAFQPHVATKFKPLGKVVKASRAEGRAKGEILFDIVTRAGENIQYALTVTKFKIDAEFSLTLGVSRVIPLFF
jgi:hypothetical protein